MTKKWLWLLLVCLALLACGKAEKSSPEGPFREVKAEIMLLSPQKIQLVQTYAGEVKAKNSLILASKISGYVKQVFVREGDFVEAGAPLLRMDDQPVHEKIKALKASVLATQKEREAVSARKKYAASNYKRFKKLYAEQAATKEEYERAEAEFYALAAKEKALTAKIKELRAKIAETRNLLSYTLLRSPVKALVVKKWVDPGSFVSAQSPLIKLDDLQSGFLFQVELDEALLGRIKSGQKFWIFFPSRNEGYWGEVYEVVSHIHPETRTFLTKLSLKTGKLSSGLYGRLYFPVEEKTTLLLPWKAVVVRGALTGVMVVEKGDIARFRVVRLGSTFMRKDHSFLPAQAPEELALARKTNLWAEVLSGLSAGEKIVVSPLSEVRDGDRIK